MDDRARDMHWNWVNEEDIRVFEKVSSTCLFGLPGVRVGLGSCAADARANAATAGDELR